MKILGAGLSRVSVFLRVSVDDSPVIYLLRSSRASMVVSELSSPLIFYKFTREIVLLSHDQNRCSLSVTQVRPIGNLNPKMGCRDDPQTRRRKTQSVGGPGTRNPSTPPPSKMWPFSWKPKLLPSKKFLKISSPLWPRPSSMPSCFVDNIPLNLLHFKIKCSISR